MPNNDTIYIKTDKGQDEIATRKHRLRPMQRAVLILVDGQISTESLLEKALLLGQDDSLVDELIAQGFIAPVNAEVKNLEATASTSTTPLRLAQTTPIHTTGTPTALETTHQNALPVVKADAKIDVAPEQRTTAQPASMVSTKRRSLAIARMYLLDSMERMYGNDSEIIRGVLRHATTKEAILSQLEHCVEIVREAADSQRADEFRQRVLDLLPE